MQKKKFRLSQVPRVIHSLHHYQKLQREETICLNTKKLILHSTCKMEIIANSRNNSKQLLLDIKFKYLKNVPILILIYLNVHKLEKHASKP